MRTMHYDGNVMFLTPILETWKEESNGDKFGIEISVPAVLRTLQGLIDSPFSTLVLLISDENIVVGFFGVFVHKSTVSDDIIANEQLWYVMPKSRGIGVLRLLKAAKAWAKEAGAKFFTASASHLASDKHNEVCKIYSKQMKHMETTFIQEL